MSETRDRLIDEALKTIELEKKVLRTKASQNLYIFNKYVLGAQDGKGKVALAPFHKELCNFTQDSKDKKKLILVPRMHLKSTLVTVGYPLWNIVNNPDIRVLILSATYQNACDFVKSIQDHLTRNQTLIETFGELGKNPIEWRNDRFTLRTNRTSLGEKEPTVMGAGIETNVVSKHFDMIILDDIVVRENTETVEQVEKVIKRYRDTIDLMDTHAELIMIGTRWVDYDVYSWVLDKENRQRDQFKVFIRAAMQWEGPIEHALKTGDGFTSSLWPEKFTREVLFDRFQAKGPYEFSTQYLNDPVPDSDATFHKDWFREYEEMDLRGEVINNYITVDPAISTEKEADYTAIVVTGVDADGNIFVRDITRARVTPDQLINIIFAKAEEFHPKKIGIEDVAYQKALHYSMHSEMQKRGRNLPVVAVKPQARSKDERIRGLQPLYANGKVFHNRVLPETRYLEDELLRFPRAKNDDLIDALSYTLDFFVKPREKSAYYRRRYLY